MDNRNKKLMLLLIMLVLIAIGIFVLYKRNKGNENFPSDSGVNTTPPNQHIDLVKKEEFESALKQVVATDQDLDGIADADEAQYKTSIDSSDTDGDGLTDWQEVFIFSTDPVKADSDNDTFTDGYEVRRGFSPKGLGKL